MAVITGITAERMQAYMDENVTSGHINEIGNLILVTRAGAQIDAGSSIPTVPLATDTEAGRVELADNAEAIAGVATDRAVTPWNLANLPGYRFQQRIKYTSSGTFQKSVYVGLKMIRVIVVGGGGGGGGAAAAGSGNHSAGGGGGGGGYAEKIIFAESLAASETVTVGAGGAGGNTGVGGAGGVSSFGTHASAYGGGAAQIFTDHPLMPAAPGGVGGAGTVGDILATGHNGGMGSGHATLGHGGIGGSSLFGGGGVGAYTASGSGGQVGGTGGNYGGGGGGASANAFATARAGGTGAPGIVIVEVYL